ncbi:hypothetical protein Bca4012_065983 [Brassica carinata]
MESRLKISKAEDEPKVNALGVEQTADILTRAHVRKMADMTTRAHIHKMVDVTRVLIAISFIRKTNHNLSEESNLEKDVTPMDGFAHYGTVKNDYLRIKFKQMRSLIGVQKLISLIQVGTNHNLSEEVRRRFYKN